MPLHRVVVLVNESAGSGVSTTDRADEIRAAFDAVGVQALVEQVKPTDMASIIGAHWAGDDRPDAVVVAGGDGTVGCAAGAVAGTDVIVGVLPLGTFNHFAKDLGIPTDLGEAVASLATATATKIDVGEVNGRVFVNNSVLGVYPKMIAIRDKLRDRHGWGKVRSVPLAVFAVLRSFPTHRIDVTAPGDVARRRLRTPLVFVGNGVYDNGDGGLPARTSLTGGNLGVGIALATSRWGLIASAWRSLRRGQASDPTVELVELPEVVVRTRGEHVRVAVDGEICRLVPPLRYTSRPGALLVLVPDDADEAEPASTSTGSATP